MIIKIDKELELKQLEQNDSFRIFELIDAQREYLGEWLPFVAFTQTITDSEQFVNSVINASQECFEYVFSIRKNNNFIGLIGFKDTDKLNRKTEMGYWLSERYQKQGIVTRCVDKLCQFAFNELEMNRIQVRCAVGNTSSANIPMRLGFTFEGIERDGELLSGNRFVDLEVYSKLKADL
ncbi:MAG: GNAT family protein [Salinivirgaceae bacterium]|nr:GNAT family protein [Salinivirgaceae bacterium]